MLCSQWTDYKKAPVPAFTIDVLTMCSLGGGGERGTAGLGVNCAEGTRAEVGVGERDAGWGGEIGGGSVTKLKCK